MGKPKKWKRKGPKSTRAGCLMCKHHKHQAVKDTAAGQTLSLKKQLQNAEDQASDLQ